MSQAASVPAWVNHTMKFILNSPLHGLVSKNVLIISFTGCKSGKTYSTPVSYSINGSQVFIFTHARWWKNLCSNTPVCLRLRGRNVQGLAKAEAEDKQKIAACLSAHLRQVRSDAAWYAVKFNKNGEPESEDVQKAVLSVVMINVQLAGTPPF
ncbi:MAG: nitroreductase/quinone reductase family protein [Anaerolineae bacterium]|nr:nitroreductase/quinone reductase family protein [Anaerolineae bacterium]